MPKFFNDNSQLPASISTPISRTAEPSLEFYSIFSKEEVLRIIHALEVERELPLKYAYKGRGAEIWDKFYLKYITPKWYRISSLELDLLRENFEYINSSLRSYEKINIVDVGAGNSCPVKEFIYRLNSLRKVSKYVALDISEELLSLSKKNFEKWFPSIQLTHHAIDVENDCLSQILLEQADVETAEPKVILHLGVTMGNHRYRDKVLENFRDSMNKDDLLVFTNEIGSNSEWDGRVRGGCKYHAEQVYEWIRNNIGIREDCELVRKYDLERDSVVANIKFLCDYTINFSFLGIDESLKISQGEEITVWRHHKYDMPALLQETERAGLQLVHYSTNKYLSHVMAICKVASNGVSLNPDVL